MTDNKTSWEDRLKYSPVPTRHWPRGMKQAIVERAQAEASQSGEARHKRIQQRRFAVTIGAAAIGLTAACVVSLVILRSDLQIAGIVQPHDTTSGTTVGIITRQTLSQGQWLQLTGMGLALLLWSAMVVTLFVLARKRQFRETVDSSKKWKWGSSGVLQNLAFLSLVPMILLGGFGFLRAQHIFQSSDPYSKGLDQFMNSLPAGSHPTHLHDGWSMTAARGTVITGWLAFRRSHPVVYLSISNVQIPLANNVKVYWNNERAMPVGSYSEGTSVALYIHTSQIPSSVRIAWEAHGVFQHVTIPRKAMAAADF